MNTLYHFFCKFAPLDQHEWEAARAAFQIRKLKKGEYLVEEGQVCRQIAFVAQGLLRLFYRLHGEEKIMLFFGEQSLASDYFSFLTGTKSIRPVQALEACELYCISAEALEELYRFKNWERIGRRLSEMAYTFAVQRANRLLHDD
ncbi:MAG: Crp/Fnr family transcriptional regulator, partial [Cyclobacteriaceae bacterium]